MPVVSKHARAWERTTPVSIMPTAKPPRELSARERAVVLAYRSSSETVEQVRKAFGLRTGQLYTILRKAREPFRRPASAKPMRVARQGLGIATSRLLGLAGPGEGDEPLSRRLERLLLARIADLEERDAPGRTVDPEKAARALALTVRTLEALRRAEPAGAAEADPDPEPAPRNLAELRDELRRHLERIRVEERARRGHPPDEPHGP